MSARPLALVFALALAPLAVAQTETEIASKEEGAVATVAYTGVDKPVDIAVGPDGTMYYAEFDTGRLRSIPPGASQPAADPIWTAPNLQLGGERGFVGLAVSPNFATDAAFYVFYQTNKTGTVVSRLSRIVEGAEEVLIDDIFSEKLHNSGRITFDNAGHMFVSVGDAVLDTAGRHRSVHAHDPANINGKVLRLTLDGKPAAGNPWGNEVWTKGHRNVYGIAVSPTGVMVGTENGPESWDEVNVLVGGQDYGWPTCSGPCGKPEYVEPILSYEDTIAPTGAVWWKGHFYFTDFNKGTVHRIYDHGNGTWADERVMKFTTPRILDIATGADALYVSTWDSIWRIVPGKVGSDSGPANPTGIVATPTGHPPATTSPPPLTGDARATPPGPPVTADPTAGTPPTGGTPGQIGESSNGIPLGLWPLVAALGGAVLVRRGFK